MTVLILVLWLLAVVRLTRLVTHDKLTEPFRAWILKHRGSDSQIAYLVHCTWCSSVWIGFATAPLVMAATDLSWWVLPTLALAASQLTGLASRLPSILGGLADGD